MKVLLFLLSSALFGHDWMIVPGERVGPVTASISEDELIKQLGPEVVKRRPIPLGDESFDDGTVLYGEDPSKALAIRWRDEGRRARPQMVYVCYGLVKGECRWKLPNGITIGTPLKELEQLNGKPFTLTGFSLQDSGMIANWMGGKLAPFMEPGKRVLFSIDGETAKGGFDPPLTMGELISLMRGVDFSSSNPMMQKLNPRISEMIVELR